MKTLFMAFLIFASSSAVAVTTDKFDCSFEIHDAKTDRKAMKTGDIFIPRLPAPSDGTYDLTAGTSHERLSLALDKGNYIADITIHYKHAVKQTASGVDARQSTCLAVSTQFCDKTTNPNGCFSQRYMCLMGEPYGDPHPWQKTSVDASGVPVFDGSHLGFFSAEMRDENGNLEGTVSGSCQFQGTYR